MEKMRLDEISTRAPEKLDKQKTKAELSQILEELDELQNLLYAECRHSLLIIIQGMDASGKDGLIKHVFGCLNPQGVAVKSFKVPTKDELAHDFLWRIHKYTPAKGMIQIFNRSHYEDVLITRVHNMITDNDAYKRMKAINDFEELVTMHNDTLILKFYMHVSYEKQKERFEERISNVKKQWKYNEQDFIESALRKDYIKAYEDCFKHCNAIEWVIVPSDQNWYKEYFVAKALRDALKNLNMQYPGLKK